jgi:FKBP-type peptidyl-prolyl cis-trans isomerase FklB
MADIIDFVPETLSDRSSKEKASYCLGLEAGNSLRMQFSDLDVNLILTGFEDAVKRNRPRVSEEEFHNVMTAIKEQVQNQQKAFISQLSQKNKKAQEAFLEDNKKKDGVITLSSGLQYKVLEEGSGASPMLTDVVKCHYKGYFAEGQVFDSSYARNEPAFFPVDRVIAGWQEALQLMKVGSKWQIFVPSYLAYGEGGYAPHIEPNKLLVFEMELLGINEQ